MVPDQQCPDTPRVGAVLRVGREVDRESREFLVDVQISDPPAQWAIGQRAEVYIRTAAAEGVVSLPWRLLLTRDGVEYRCQCLSQQCRNSASNTCLSIDPSEAPAPCE